MTPLYLGRCYQSLRIIYQRQGGSVDQGGDGLTRQQYIGQRKINCGLGIALSFRYVRVM